MGNGRLRPRLCQKSRNFTRNGTAAHICNDCPASKTSGPTLITCLSKYSLHLPPLLEIPWFCTGSAVSWPSYCRFCHRADDCSGRERSLAEQGAWSYAAISGTSSTARGSGDVANVQSEPPLPGKMRRCLFGAGAFIVSAHYQKKSRAKIRDAYNLQTLIMLWPRCYFANKHGAC